MQDCDKTIIKFCYCTFNNKSSLIRERVFYVCGNISDGITCLPVQGIEPGSL